MRQIKRTTENSKYGSSLKEIALHYKIPVNTVKKDLYTAISKLEKHFKYKFRTTNLKKEDLI